MSEVTKFLGETWDSSLIGATFEYEGLTYMIETFYEGTCYAYSRSPGSTEYLYLGSASTRKDVESSAVWVDRPGSFQLLFLGRPYSSVKEGSKVVNTDGVIYVLTCKDVDLASFEGYTECGLFKQFYADRIAESERDPNDSFKFLEEPSEDESDFLRTAFAFPQDKRVTVDQLRAFIDFIRDSDADPEFITTESLIYVIQRKDKP